MPSVKHWFHVSQDLNRDPEFRSFTKTFGLGGARFWLEALAILDRTDNYWCLEKGFDLGLLAACCETKRRIIQGSFEYLRDMNWLKVGVNLDQKLFIYAPKWSEYNKRREDKGSRMDTTQEHKSLYPTPSPTPTPNKDICEPKVQPQENARETKLFFEFWKAYPNRNGKKLEKSATEALFNRLSINDQTFAVVAAQNYAASDLVKKHIGIKDPKRFLKNGKNSEPWRDWIEPEIKTKEVALESACVRRIEKDGRLKPCGKPSCTTVGKSPMCKECYQAFLIERESTHAS